MILSSNRVGYKTLTTRFRIKLMNIRKNANRRYVPAVYASSWEFLGNRKTVRKLSDENKTLVT